MRKKIMSSEKAFSYVHLSNVDLIDKMYAQFEQDPEALEGSWRAFFEGVEFANYLELKGKGKADIRVLSLIDAYRRFGHLKAKVSPIGQVSTSVKALELEHLGFEKSELKSSFPTFGLLEQESASLEEIISFLEALYCGSLSVEFLDRGEPAMVRWLQERLERSAREISLEEKRTLLEHLNKAELFETFLHSKYVGQTRFSLEGSETLIPLLFEMISKAAEKDVDEFVIGMPHRGRLNVLANILQKSYSTLFGEFEGFYDPEVGESAEDINYHKGFSSTVELKNGKKVHLSLMANPSHLESVACVVQGSAYCKQRRRGKEKVAPILIHGDSSLAGQGVVYETLQLSKLQGYSTQGTLHIIVNNQIGFTTLPEEYKSTTYSSDIARAFGMPVFHVNAEDPEACLFAAKLAVELREHFGVDVFIDLVGYRKLGHNESDEPAFTQPLIYKEIRKKKSIRATYRDLLIQQGVIEKEIAESLESAFKKELHYELEEMKLSFTPSHQKPFEGEWSGYHAHQQDEVITQVDSEVLQSLAKRFSIVPEGFALHPKLVKLIEERLEKVQRGEGIDWSLAEHLAFASLLSEGHPIRFVGQDAQRGTFTQRHLTFVDQKSGARYFPLNHLQEEQGELLALNSPLSEYAALGFEFGYSLASPLGLVAWEAQYGDFANGAQVIFDQYLSTSEQKWHRHSGLVVLLPHGYEGHGSEHSSARLERFLQLAGEENMQIVYPTTPAQYFHLLRKQVLQTMRVPLIVMTPKGLLRHPLCVSSMEAFSSGAFLDLIDDPLSLTNAKRLIFCSGRVYYDLLQEREKRERFDVALVRLEKLYPFNQALFPPLFEKYRALQELYWVQEEPQNMGAWSYISPLLQGVKPSKVPLYFVGRKRSASPACGSHKKHLIERSQLLDRAFN